VEQRFLENGMNMIRSSLQKFLSKGQITEMEFNETLARDIRIASENAKIGQTEINIGLIPVGMEPKDLTKAKELIFTGKIIDAKTAEQLGLVNVVILGKILGRPCGGSPWSLPKKPP